MLFSGLFLSYLLRQLAYDQVIGTGEEALIREQYGIAMLARTNNDRKTLGTMNDFIFQFKSHFAGQTTESIDLAAVNHFVNGTPTKARGAVKNKVGWPIRDMKALVSQLGKLSIWPGVYRYRYFVLKRIYPWQNRWTIVWGAFSVILLQERI